MSKVAPIFLASSKILSLKGFVSWIFVKMTYFVGFSNIAFSSSGFSFFVLFPVKRALLSPDLALLCGFLDKSKNLY